MKTKIEYYLQNSIFGLRCHNIILLLGVRRRRLVDGMPAFMNL